MRPNPGAKHRGEGALAQCTDVDGQPPQVCGSGRFHILSKVQQKQEAPEYDAPWKSRIFCDSLQRHYPHQVQGSKVYLPLCLSHKLPLLCCYGRIIHLCPPAHKYILIRRSIRALYPSNPGASYSLKIEHLVPGEVGGGLNAIGPAAAPLRDPRRCLLYTSPSPRDS